MYKKLLLVLVSVITIQTVKAQTEKGSQMLGASFSISTFNSNQRVFDSFTNSYGNNTKTKLTTYSIAPSYSYFIADKLDVGVSLAYGRTKADSDDGLVPQDQDAHNYNGQVYLRKYFLFENKIGVRTGPYFNYGRSTSKQFYNNITGFDYKSSYYTGGIGLDFIYFPVKRFGLAAGLGSINYNHQKISGTTQGSGNGFNLNFANSLTLSVNYIFGH